jgi:hypothetical protein
VGEVGCFEEGGEGVEDVGFCEDEGGHFLEGCGGWLELVDEMVWRGWECGELSSLVEGFEGGTGLLLDR